jgi:hypothetical protein
MARVGLTAEETIEEIVELGRSGLKEALPDTEGSSPSVNTGWSASLFGSWDTRETGTPSLGSSGQHKEANGPRFEVEFMKEAIKQTIERRNLKFDAKMIEDLGVFGIAEAQGEESSSNVEKDETETLVGTSSDSNDDAQTPKGTYV